MPNIALYRPAISQPCGLGEVGACAYRGGGRGGECGPLSIFFFGGGGGGGVRTPLDFLRNTSHLLV